MIKRVLICGAVAAMLAPETGRAFAPSYQCVFKTSCSADAGGCEATKVSYGLARADETWTVFDAYNQSEIDEVRVETMEDAVSLRWREGGVTADQLPPQSQKPRSGAGNRLMLMAELVEQLAGDILGARGDDHRIAARPKHLDRPVKEQRVRRVDDVDQHAHRRLSP